MIKKILPISVFILLAVLIVLFGIQNLMNRSTSQGLSSLTPTLFQQKQTGGYTLQTNTTNKTGSTSPTGTAAQTTAAELQNKLPIYAPDFTLEYSPRMQKYVAVIVDDEAANSYSDWVAQNPSYENELQNTIVTKQTLQELNDALDYAKTKELTPEKKAQQDATIFTNTLNTLINLPFLFMQSTGATDETPSPFPTPAEQTRLPSVAPISVSPTNYELRTTPSSKLTYYSQCDGPYDEKPLPNGCTVCKAGCGPVSVAMILSSYVDKSLNPLKTIDLMSKAGVDIGCNGSYISQIYSYLKRRGDLKVSDYIIPSSNDLSAKEVAKDFQGYTKAGWTIFVLANFKKDGGGHYFWVTDVSNNGDILAYDPYYGKGQTAPISENKYNPAPYYRYAFAVKKNSS